MENKFSSVSLEGIMSSYDFVIFDTCAISETFGKYFKECKTHYEALTHVNNTINFEKHIKEKVAGGSNIYITSGVYDEIFDVESYSVKRTAKINDGKIRRNLIPVSRAIKESRKTLRQLAKTFLDNNRILNFKNRGNKFYEKLSHRHVHLKDKLGLSETDFDIIISGLYLKETERSSAVLTNDAKLCDAGYAILFGGDISPKNLDFLLGLDLMNLKNGFSQKLD